ncbi:preprotein translocase subunit SecE [Nocardioides limicola]|uniref:preprotein translocase subunit SecE n=1 Tax=Nocardioides limicola TaxID=2803368 RepID=UPI00193BAD7B|nr:preprotein translocase subunit SecE [Nocardioides sp. DJM-14]
MSDTNTADDGGRPATPTTGSAGWANPIAFLRQVVAELRKVVWPTQQQLITYFIVVMVFVLIMMAIISALDLGFGRLAYWIFTGGNA